MPSSCLSFLVTLQDDSSPQATHPNGVHADFPACGWKVRMHATTFAKRRRHYLATWLSEASRDSGGSPAWEAGNQVALQGGEVSM